MRLDEIDNPIRETLKKYFDTKGKISIKDNIVSVAGDCSLKIARPDNRFKILPVKFSIVNGTFDCSNHILDSIEGSPDYVSGDFWCTYNRLKDLTGGPTKVEGNYQCYTNRDMQSLKGVAKIINGELACYECNIKTFDYLPEFIGSRIILSYNQNLPVLKLLSINGLKNIAFYPKFTKSIQVEDILNNYIGKGRGGMLAAAAELTKAGLKGNARL